MKTSCWPVGMQYVSRKSFSVTGKQTVMMDQMKTPAVCTEIMLLEGDNTSKYDEGNTNLKLHGSTVEISCEK